MVPLIDYECPQCGKLLEDHRVEIDEIDGVKCPDCRILMKRLWTLNTNVIRIAGTGLK